MQTNGKKIAIVGGGIAGLCAAVYAQECGYQADVFEMHDMAGGLATNWRRGDYTFETCMHWLWGSNPGGPMHKQWLEVCDLDKLKFLTWDRIAQVETGSGDRLNLYTDCDRLEAELLSHAPQDAVPIRRLTAAIRKLGEFRMPDPCGSWAVNLRAVLGNIPRLPLFRELMKVSAQEYGRRFSDPLVRSIFGEGDMSQISALAILFSLAWMNKNDAGYPIGGSQALIRLIEERLARLGGRVHFGARVERILVDRDTAVGVRLASGDTYPADWVISAADGHSTIYEMLGGNYTSKKIDLAYSSRETFPSYLQVSLGVARDLSSEPPQLTRLLDEPLEVDPGTELKQLSFRIFHFDPTFAPSGKTAVTCFLPTRNYGYWVSLHRDKPSAYSAEKRRISERVIAVLEKRIPDIRDAIEVIDVSSPASVIRYTGNWRGSMEGWWVAPGSSFRQLPNTLPGLRRFMMVGQWVMPGGGLPSGPMTARPAIQAICKHDHVPFTPGLPASPANIAPPIPIHGASAR